MLLFKVIIALCGFPLFIFETTLALPLETKEINVLSKSANTASATGILKPRSGFTNGFVLGNLGYYIHQIIHEKKEKKEKEKEEELREDYCKQRDFWMEESYDDCMQSKDEHT